MDDHAWALGDVAGERTPPDDDRQFFEWTDVFPELAELVRAAPEIRAEAEALEEKACFSPWPQPEHVKDGDWKIAPFVHTYPLSSKSEWVAPVCARCPLTASLLRRIPALRNASFSRLAPRTRLEAHRGWGVVANHVLRCHLGLRVPAYRSCGVWVEGCTRASREGELLVFDDSKRHKAFNASETQSRLVLILDLVRPPHIPLGTAPEDQEPTREISDLKRQFA